MFHCGYIPVKTIRGKNFQSWVLTNEQFCVQISAAEEISWISFFLQYICLIWSVYFLLFLGLKFGLRSSLRVRKFTLWNSGCGIVWTHQGTIYSDTNTTFCLKIKDSLHPMHYGKVLMGGRCNIWVSIKIKILEENLTFTFYFFIFVSISPCINYENEPILSLNAIFANWCFSQMFKKQVSEHSWKLFFGTHFVC